MGRALRVIYYDQRLLLQLNINVSPYRVLSTPQGTDPVTRVKFSVFTRGMEYFSSEENFFGFGIFNFSLSVCDFFFFFFF